MESKQWWTGEFCHLKDGPGLLVDQNGSPASLMG